MIIVKIGGGKGVTDNLDIILKDFASLKDKKILVHGANHEMKVISEKLGKPERIVKSPSGFNSRYTDRETLEIFEMVYAGVANKRIVEKLHKLGINAIGLSGLDGKLLVGKRKPIVKIVRNGKVKILRNNFTGTVEKVNVNLIKLLLDNGYVPVIVPPAISFDNVAINVDNDRIVGALCKYLDIDKVISLFEASGLLKDINDPDSLIKLIDKNKLDEYIGFAQGRMKKKIHHAKEAFEGGVKEIYFGDARVNNPITNALNGNGTAIR